MLEKTQQNSFVFHSEKMSTFIYDGPYGGFNLSYAYVCVLCRIETNNYSFTSASFEDMLLELWTIDQKAILA